MSGALCSPKCLSLLSLCEFPQLGQIVLVPPAGKTHPLLLQLLNYHSTPKNRQWSCFRLQGWDPARGSRGERLFVERVRPSPTLIQSPAHPGCLLQL